MKQIIYFGVLLVIFSSCSGSFPCDLRDSEYGKVCVCTSDYCDFLPNPEPAQDNELIVVSSSKAGLRFDVSFSDFSTAGNNGKVVIANKVENAKDSKSTPNSVRNVTLRIDRVKTHQVVLGFGGSYTGATSYLLSRLPQDLQDNIFKSYYGDDGNRFNLMRISIGGCDFDLSPWAYNEVPENDAELSNFTTLDHRDETRIAQIKRTVEIAQPRNLRIKAAAWSAPPWMKSNNDWTGFSHLKRIYYKTWADYHIKWLQLMKANGIPIWAISTGNEPLNGVINMYFVKFMSMGWIPKNQAIWLSDYLGPSIRESEFKDIIIFNNDDQRYSLTWWLKTMNETRPNVLKYIDGAAVHWYWDEMIEASFIDEARELVGEKMLFLNSESCIGDKPWQKDAPLLGSWERGEKYARAFLQDFQHSFNGWIDWNIVLDEVGGPNYVDNTVDAPVIVNTTTFTEVYKQPMFYTMGHFSKFIPENSVRIDAIRSNMNIDSVAFLRPDSSIAVIIFNSGKSDVNVQLEDSIRSGTIINIPPRSIHTLIYK